METHYYRIRNLCDMTNDREYSSIYSDSRLKRLRNAILPIISFTFLGPQLFPRFNLLLQAQLYFSVRQLLYTNGLGKITLAKL